jgi:high-affinity nickel-transport protein
VVGFFLGVRHATDADHIVAIATIVSRQRTMHGSMQIGAAWGVGHTITVMTVGSAIVLFGVVIPPWLGLSMELAVGLMLVLLGVLTLTGMSRGVGGGRAAQYTAMATTCIGIRMVTARTTTIMPVTERNWRCSTAVGSAAYHSINCCGPLQSV